MSTFAAYSSDARVATWLRGVGVLETSHGVRVTVLVVARTVACLDALNLSYMRQLKTEADDPLHSFGNAIAAPPSSSTYSHFCV